MYQVCLTRWRIERRVIYAPGDFCLAETSAQSLIAKHKSSNLRMANSRDPRLLWCGSDMKHSLPAYRSRFHEYVHVRSGRQYCNGVSYHRGCGDLNRRALPKQSGRISLVVVTRSGVQMNSEQVGLVIVNARRYDGEDYLTRNLVRHRFGHGQVLRLLLLVTVASKLFCLLTEVYKTVSLL